MRRYCLAAVLPNTPVHFHDDFVAGLTATDNLRSMKVTDGLPPADVLLPSREISVSSILNILLSCSGCRRLSIGYASLQRLLNTEMAACKDTVVFCMTLSNMLSFILTLGFDTIAQTSLMMEIKILRLSGIQFT
eukprot:scaffold13462_cov36-Cyclotella_meneghiniana.AAC.1